MLRVSLLLDSSVLALLQQPYQGGLGMWIVHLPEIDDARRETTVFDGLLDGLDALFAQLGASQGGVGEGMEVVFDVDGLHGALDGLELVRRQGEDAPKGRLIHHCR
jgi:hypothetical protein